MNFNEKLDTYKHKGLRKQLVKLLSQKKISDMNVLAAIDRVPRHLFIGESAFDTFAAYEDKAFPIGAGQTISQPYTVAYQTSLLHLKKGEKVLEIGTGSGYQTAVLCEMGVKVYSIERQKSLFTKTKLFLETHEYPCRLFFGDGYKGIPSFAPYDKIIVTAGAPFVPQDLILQLKPGGILVIPVGEGATQVMCTLVKDSDGNTEMKEHNKFSFVPLLENKEM